MHPKAPDEGHDTYWPDRQRQQQQQQQQQQRQQHRKMTEQDRLHDPDVRNALIAGDAPPDELKTRELRDKNGASAAIKKQGKDDLGFPKDDESKFS